MTTTSKNEDYVYTIPEGPIIVSLHEEPLLPRPVALFDTLAKDFSADCKYKFDRLQGKTPLTAPQQRSASYRKARQEFLWFMCCYGAVGIATVCMGIFLVVNAIWDNEEFDGIQHVPSDHYTGLRSSTDDDYSAYKATNLLEMIKYFFYADGGFND